MKMHNIPSEFPNTIVLYLKEGEVTAHNTVTAAEPHTSHWRVSDDLSSTSWFAYAAASSVNAFLWIENHHGFNDLPVLSPVSYLAWISSLFADKKRWKMAKKLQVQRKYIGFIISHRTNRLRKAILPPKPLLHIHRFYFWPYRQINERRGIMLPTTILTCNYASLKYFQHKFPFKSPQITKHQNANT